MSATDAPAEAEEVLLPVEEKMAELLNEVKGELATLEPQYQRLVSIRARLEGQTSTPAQAPAPTRRRASGSSNSGSGSGTRAREGSRLDQFMAAVRAEPGQKIPHYAKVLGIENNYLYRVRAKAEAENVIRVEGQNIFPVEAAA